MSRSRDISDLPENLAKMSVSAPDSIKYKLDLAKDQLQQVLLMQLCITLKGFIADLPEKHRQDVYVLSSMCSAGSGKDFEYL